MVNVENLNFSYGNHKVLNNINFLIKKGEFISIIGHNGSGKTTLIKLILGLLKTKNGNIFINGHNINSRLWKKNRTILGYINQGSINTNLPITVREVIEIGHFYNNKDLSNNKYKINDVLKLIGIENLSNRLFRTLSGGQKQKVNIARCLIQNPKIMILDEPNSFLDYTSQFDIMNILKKLNENNKITIIMISHDLSLVKDYSHKIYLLENNKLKKITDSELDFPIKLSKSI